MVKRILLGIGGTPFTTVAIERAVVLAKEHGASLKAVTVVNPDQLCKLGPVPAGAGIYAKRMCENRVEVTQAQIEQSIELLQAHCRQSEVPLDVEREIGETFSLIIDHARYHDLIIFGLRSVFEYQLVQEPEKDLLKLLSKGARPIIAVSNTFRPINNVMIAYNGSMESANAMKYFVQLNLWSKAKLDIVHIGDDNPQHRNLVDDAAAFCADHGYMVKTHLIPGKASDQLLPVARRIDADMIVMGRSLGNMLVRRVLGDTVLNTLANTHRPLFLS
jgi:nucleotide-binding universal stress UspA family protein